MKVLKQKFERPKRRFAHDKGQFFQEVNVEGKVRHSEGLGVIVETTVLEFRDLGRRMLDKRITGS